MEEIAQSKNIIADTKKYILNTARHLFSEHSYLGVSMSDIAKKINITKAALYYHFTGKAEIYRKVIDEVFEDFKRILTEALNEKTLNKQIFRLIRNYLYFGSREKNFIIPLLTKFLPNDPKIKESFIRHRKEIDSLIQPLVRKLLESKNLSKKVDTALMTSLFTGMMDGLLLEYSFLNKEINSGELANQIIIALF